MSDETILPETKFASEIEALMPPLAAMARPEGQSDEYRFFTNEATGQAWKVKMLLKEARAADVQASEAVAPANLAATITVSPVDDQGKALREGGKPIVIDSWTHTFNEVEMAEPGFDPHARAMAIIAERINAGEARLAGMDKLRALASNWKTERKF